MASDADALQQAATVVRHGGVIAYPTEAVYGLGCDPLNEMAVLRLLQIKQRDVSQGLILIGQSLDDFSAFIQPLKDDIEDKLLASWPGPVSWLVAISDDCPPWICGKHQTVAIRVTAHQQTRALCTTAQMPLVSTSANRSGQAPAITAAEVEQQLGDDVDYILAGETDGQGRPCQIRDSENEKIIRR